jgi:hypothetical protein
VRSQPLTWDGHRLALGAERIEAVRWARGGHERPDVPDVGELVSCHWDWVCDRLTRDQLAHLRTRSGRQLDIANRSLASRSGDPVEPGLAQEELPPR